MDAATGISRRQFFGAGPTPALRILDTCLAEAGVHCQSCGDACPEAAIRFRPRLGAPPMPVVDHDTCTACGECVAACPADAIELMNAEERGDGR